MVKLYELIIYPTSSFGTPLVGDTLFGHLCWQFAYDGSLLAGEFSELITSYCSKPFLVVSSAVPRIVVDGKAGYALQRPDLSLFSRSSTPDTAKRKQRMEERKEQKKKKWLFTDTTLQIRFDHRLLLTDKELTRGVLANMDKTRRQQLKTNDDTRFMTRSTRTHNSINRLTNTTGKGFDPFSVDVISYLPGTALSLFVLVDEQVVAKDALRKAFARVGSFGYGRDGSVGLGRFEVGAVITKELAQCEGANSCYTLAPCLPRTGKVQQSWFQPLTRFGKHGGAAVLKGNPFKKPVVMAAEAAVFRVEETLFAKPYIGQGIDQVSKAIPETVVQGYSLYLPCKVEV